MEIGSFIRSSEEYIVIKLVIVRRKIYGYWYHQRLQLLIVDVEAVSRVLPRDIRQEPVSIKQVMEYYYQ